MKVYDFNTVLEEVRERHLKGKTVKEALEENHKVVFELIKKYKLIFSDDVLAECNITRIEHPHHVYQEDFHIERDVKADTKKLKKDTKALEDILDEMEDDRLPKFTEEKGIKTDDGSILIDIDNEKDIENK